MNDQKTLCDTEKFIHANLNDTYNSKNFMPEISFANKSSQSLFKLSHEEKKFAYHEDSINLDANAPLTLMRSSDGIQFNSVECVDYDIAARNTDLKKDPVNELIPLPAVLRNIVLQYSTSLFTGELLFNGQSRRFVSGSLKFNEFYDDFLWLYLLPYVQVEMRIKSNCVKKFKLNVKKIVVSDRPLHDYSNKWGEHKSGALVF